MAVKTVIKLISPIRSNIPSSGPKTGPSPARLKFPISKRAWNILVKVPVSKDTCRENVFRLKTSGPNRKVIRGLIRHQSGY